MLKHPVVAEVDLPLDNLLDSMVVVLVVLEVQVVVDTITKVMVAQVADKHLVQIWIMEAVVQDVTKQVVEQVLVVMDMMLVHMDMTIKT